MQMASFLPHVPVCRLEAVDSHGAVAVVHVTIIVCDCTSHLQHATCDFGIIQSGYKATDFFQLVRCQCRTAWTGGETLFKLKKMLCLLLVT